MRVKKFAVNAKVFWGVLVGFANGTLEVSKFNMPADAKFSHAWYDNSEETFWIVLESKDFADTCGGEIPALRFDAVQFSEVNKDDKADIKKAQVVETHIHYHYHSCGCGWCGAHPNYVPVTVPLQPFYGPFGIQVACQQKAIYEAPINGSELNVSRLLGTISFN